MAKRIFVTATNTGIGKTYTALKLMETLSARGVRVGALKPIETGVESIPEDGVQLYDALIRFNPEAKHLTLNDVVPIQYALPAAPFIAKEDRTIDYQAIDDALARMESICDVCLIEGAGGLLVPIDEVMSMIDLIIRFEAQALLVSHCHLGCINDTLLSLEALKRRDIPSHFVLNCMDGGNGFEEISQPFFDRHFKQWFRLQQDIEQLAGDLI